MINLLLHILDIHHVFFFRRRILRERGWPKLLVEIGGRNEYQSIIAFVIKNARNWGEKRRTDKDRVATMIEGMGRRGKEKRDGSIGQRAGRMCEYPSDVCSQRWPHSRRLAPHGRRTESGKHGRESISHKIPTSRHHPFGYLCRFLLHRVYASSFSCFRLYIYTLSRKVYSFWGIERGFGGGKNG